MATNPEIYHNPEFSEWFVGVMVDVLITLNKEQPMGKLLKTLT